MRQGNRFTSDAAYCQRISIFTSRFEYIGGGINDNYLYLICKDCGVAIRRSKVGFKPSHRHLIECPHCNQMLSDKRDRDEQAKRERRTQELLIKQQKRQEAKEAREHARIKTYVCQRCGKEFESDHIKKYCSKECAQRQYFSNKDQRRRVRCMAQKHDNISLKMLSIRDKDRCWICGKKVDWNDCELRENNIFAAFNNYPSIDHVMPLSKGGAHTWDNVRLAHCGCNSKKSDKLMIEEPSGQIRLTV